MRIRHDIDRIKSLIITRAGESDHYGEMMKTFFRTEKARHPIADYTGVGLREWLPKRRAILRKFAEAVGPMPDRKTAPHAKVHRRYDRGDYTVEGVSFYTRPDWPVTALLYLPKSAPGPAPGVVVVHGHSFAQKAFATYQKVAIHLAKEGYAVLAVDFVGGGERKPQAHENLAMYMAGQTVQGLMLWDNMRAIDYLMSRPEVDGERIGITGASGGGNQSAFTTVMDERIKASAPVNAVCMFDEHLTVGIDNFCPCEVIPGIWTFAEYSDLMATVAPRPLLICQAVKDRLFPIKGVREVYYKAREVYKAFGRDGDIELHEDYGPHSYAEQIRIAVIRFFDKHLKGIEPRPVEDYEDFITVENEESEVLRALPGGKLPSGTDTLNTICGKFSADLPEVKRPRNAAGYRHYRAEVHAHLARLYKKPSETPPLDVEEFPAAPASWGRVRPFCFTSERGIVVPSVLIEPKDAAPSRIVIHADNAGKARAVELRAIEDIVRGGAAVLAMDLRGTGETFGVAPGEDSGFTLNRSIMLGRHISMMRAFDISRGVDAVKRFAGYERLPVYMWAEGEASMVALLAFAMDTRIKRYAASDLLLTYKSDSGFRQSDAILPPGILLGADVADIIASTLERPMLIARGVTPTGARPGAEAVQETLKPAFDAARAARLDGPQVVSGEVEKVEATIVAFLLE